MYVVSAAVTLMFLSWFLSSTVSVCLLCLNIHLIRRMLVKRALLTALSFSIGPNPAPFVLSSSSFVVSASSGEATVGKELVRIYSIDLLSSLFLTFT